MAAQGATLQNYNNELVKCVDDLKEKREEVNKAILKDVRAPPSPTACHAFGAEAPRRGGHVANRRALCRAGGGEEQDPERSAHPDRAVVAHQRVPRPQGTPPRSPAPELLICRGSVHVSREFRPGKWSTADVRRGGLAQIASRNEYDKTIAETEAAYMKILESSQTLLNVLKRETVNLVK